jgi:hypothetical protein
VGGVSADQATAAFSRGITSVAARTALSMNPYMTADVSVPAQWMRSHRSRGRVQTFARIVERREAGSHFGQWAYS